MKGRFKECLMAATTRNGNGDLTFLGSLVMVAPKGDYGLSFREYLSPRSMDIARILEYYGISGQTLKDINANLNSVRSIE